METTWCLPCYPFCHWERSPHGMNPKPSTSPIARIIDQVGQTKPITRRDTRIQNHAYKKSEETQIIFIDNLIINPQFIGSRQTHRKRKFHRIDVYEDHGELCIEDPRERISHLATSYGPVGLWWTTHASSERSWCWWRSPPPPKSPPAGCWEESPDEISRKRKLAASEKYFRGSPDFFVEYLGICRPKT